MIFAVSKYGSPLRDLPGCDRDALALEAICKHGGRFDETLLLSGAVSSAEVKSKLTAFVTSQRGRSVGDLLFYFSGHGLYSGNEFYYLLSDYDPGKLSQRSLENSEVDSMLRSLAPNVTAKIVDACFSGLPYVKEGAGQLKAYLDSTKSSFKTCYFLFSSRLDQTSRATETMSVFTRSIAGCVRDTSGPVRYKDLIDRVADDFRTDPNQTPYFVIQGD